MRIPDSIIRLCRSLSRLRQSVRWVPPLGFAESLRSDDVTWYIRLIDRKISPNKKMKL